MYLCTSIGQINHYYFKVKPTVYTEAESKEKHGVWDPLPELTIYNLTLCPLPSRLQHIYHGQPYATVDLLPQSGTLDLISVQYCNV